MSTFAHRAEIIVPARRKFPLDMLRYDRCCPDRQDDVSRLEDALEYREDGSPSELVIRVVRISPSKVNPWTEARWQSFGVVCKPLNSERVR